jgi:hypothetical protein
MQMVTSWWSPATLLLRIRQRWQALDLSWRWAVKLFLGYRIVFSIWAAWVSAVFPRYAPEAAVPLWPIVVPPALWIRRAVLWPIVRYDVLWYVGIAEHSYAYREGSTAFHPLYPLLMGLFGRLIGGHYLLAGWLIAQICCVAMLALLYRLVLLDYDAGVAQRATLFLIGSPLGFVFMLPYAESLLLLGIVGAFYAARRRRWWLAGFAGACAALSKQPGVVVVLPLLWELWHQQRDALRARRLRPLVGPLLGLALIPLGLLAFLAYRASYGDIGFWLSNPGSLVSALLVTPTYQDIWGHYFAWPWQSFAFAIERLRTAPSFYLVLNTCLMLIAVVLILYSAMRQRPSYTLYSIALMLLNMSIIFPLVPYISVVRRFTIIFPLFIQLAIWGRSRGLTLLIMSCNTLLWVYISEAYVRNAYIP